MEFLSDLTCLCRRCHEIFHGKVQVIDEQMRQDQKSAAQVKKLTNLFAKHGPVQVRPIVKEEIDAMMPPGDGPITLTPLLIGNVQINGAFTGATMRALNVTDQRAGWPSRLCGQTVQRANYRMALEGRHLYSRKGAARHLAPINPIT